MFPDYRANLVVLFCIAFRLVASDPCTRANPETGGCLVQTKNCFLWADRLSLEVDTNDKSKPVKEIYHMQNISSFTGNCLEKSENNSESGSITLDFKQPKPMTIEFTLHSTGDGGFWMAQKASVSLEGQVYKLSSHEITASDGFSFSCNQLILRSHGENPAVLTIHRFQLQPFASEKTVFAESFDCSTWFTIPTWMGLISMSFFSFIVSVGVYFLFNIKSPDRFESAKSKPLTIATSE